MNRSSARSGWSAPGVHGGPPPWRLAALAWLGATLGACRQVEAEPLPAAVRAALASAVPGERVRLPPGRWAGPLTLDRPGVEVEAEGVTLVGYEALVVVEGPGVKLHGLRIEGAGQRADDQSAALRVLARDVSLDGVVVSGWRGPAVQVVGGGLSGRLDTQRVQGPAVLVAAGGQAALVDSVLRGQGEGADGRALVLAMGAGSQVSLTRSFIGDAAAGCVQASDGAAVRLRDAVVVGCGLSPDGRRPPSSLLATKGGVVQVERSLVLGPAADPHGRAAVGAVELDENSLLNVNPGLSSGAAGEAYLVVSVDDTPNLGHALRLAQEMEARGLRLTFFANLAGEASPGTWAGLRALLDAGHEIGCHGATNGHLTQGPVLRLSAAAPGFAVEIDPAGRALWVERDGVQLERLELDDPRFDALGELCAGLDALPELGCAVLASESGGPPVFAASAGLESGRWALTEAALNIAWDRRAPSAGGRHFQHELVAVAERLRSGLGAPSVCAAFAYPGQQHDAVVRAAVAESGFQIARGAAAEGRGEDRWTQPFDRWQAPRALTVAQVKGPDYAALDPAGRRARVEAFAAAWAGWAQEAGGMGALTLHGPSSMDAEELGWLLDGLPPGVRVVTMSGLLEALSARGSALPDGRLWVELPDRLDLRPVAGSPLVDAGDPALGLGPDPWGTPRYGAPDLGPRERRPEGSLEAGPPPGQGRLRFYEDGRYDVLGGASEEGAGVLRAALLPAGGLGAVGGLAPEAPRGLLGTLQVAPEAGGLRLRGALERAACLSFTGLGEASWALVPRDGGSPAGRLPPAGAVALPAGGVDLALLPAAAGPGGAPLPGCAAAIP